MEVSFNDLKYLVTVVSSDLLKDDFGNLQDSCINHDSADISYVSDEIYDKVHLLNELLVELYKHRPLPF